MILGIGNDLVDIRRIEKALQRHGERFEQKCFTPYERDVAKARGLARRTDYFAKRFAAKEACAKALGTGFVGEFTLRDIGVEEDQAGRPFLVLSGGAHKVLHAMVPDGLKPRLHLTLSDERPYALAFVVIEAIS